MDSHEPEPIFAMCRLHACTRPPRSCVIKDSPSEKAVPTEEGMPYTTGLSVAAPAGAPSLPPSASPFPAPPRLEEVLVAVGDGPLSSTIDSAVC